MRTPLPAALRQRPSLLLPERPYSESELQEASAAGLQRMMAGLDMLLDHYGIERSPSEAHWIILSWSLAMDYVPYFQYGPTRGRTKRWTRVSLLTLWGFIELERVKGRTVEEACERLAGDFEYKDLEYKADSADSLVQRYKDAQRFVREHPENPHVQLMKAAIVAVQKTAP